GTSDSCTEAALAAALSGGGSVTFNCGGPKTIVLLTEHAISHNTTLDGASLITLSGSFTSTARLFSVALGHSFTVKNIVLANGHSGDNNGGLIVNHGTLTLQNVNLRDGRANAGNRGGAVATDGPLFVNASTFFDDIAGRGGALYASGAAARVQVAGSDFNFNQAFSTLDGYGGAIWVDALAQLTLDHSIVVNNQAYRGGG